MAKDKTQKPKAQPSGDLPKHVIFHVKLLLDSLQPAANWTPQSLRNHADSKEVFDRFAAMFEVKKPAAKPEPEAKK